MNNLSSSAKSGTLVSLPQAYSIVLKLEKGYGEQLKLLKAIVQSEREDSVAHLAAIPLHPTLYKDS